MMHFSTEIYLRNSLKKNLIINRRTIYAPIIRKHIFGHIWKHEKLPNRSKPLFYAMDHCIKI